MSLKSWMKEFYPTEAFSKKALAEPVTHSLRKWKGLTKTNLRKPGLVKNPDDDFIYKDDNAVLDQRDRFDIDAENCACCMRYDPNNQDCDDCPLMQFHADGCHSAYIEFTMDSDARPMIRLLEKALKKGFK